MKRALFFIYGLVAHLGFLAVFLYLIGFLGNFGVPKSVDGPGTAPLLEALVVNLLLLVVFGVQHSVMARPTFKRWWTRIIPTPIERSTYVMISNLLFVLLFWQWRPMPAAIWDIDNSIAAGALWGLFGCGWLLVVVASLQINHFDLFGTRQVWLYLRGQRYTPIPFRTPALYRYARHPLYVGWMLAFWATPTMSAGHLLYAIATTAYMLIAIQFEERNLIQFFGDDYANYRKRVPMLIPRPGKSFRRQPPRPDQATEPG